MSAVSDVTVRRGEGIHDDGIRYPPVSAESQQGYLQVSLTNEGMIQVRGTRSLMNWLIQELAKDGWCVNFENSRWCG